MGQINQAEQVAKNHIINELENTASQAKIWLFRKDFLSKDDHS